AYPDVKVTQVAWQATDDQKATPKIRPTVQRDPPQVRSASKAAAAPAQGNQAANPENNPNPPFAGGRYEVALLEGTIRVASNDFRGARAQVERLVNDIGQVEGFRADVVDSPLDTNPNYQLSGHLQEGEAKTMDSRFVLRIVREHPAT